METSVLCRLNSAVEKYGDKIAYKDPENSLTFRQFNELTRSIGTYLARYVRQTYLYTRMLPRRGKSGLLLRSDGRRYARDPSQPDPRRYQG